MLGFGKRSRKREKCFFCPNPAGEWKLEVKTSEGVISKPICADCQEYLQRMAAGESLSNMLHDPDFEEEYDE